MYKTVTYNLFKTLKLIFAAVLFFVLFSIFLSTKHAGAISNNFPRGVYNTDEWVLLSQYQCPGHCLQTPSAYVSIFYKQSDLAADFGYPGNSVSLGISVTTDCRYSGTPSGQLTLTGGTSTTAWPGITCTGLNTPTTGITKSYSIPSGSLICGSPKYPGWCYAQLTLHVNPTPGNQPVMGEWIVANYAKAKVTATEDPLPTQSYPASDCYTGAGGSCTTDGNGPPQSVNRVVALWNNYNNNGPDTHSNWSMHFAPDCTVTTQKTVYLRWYDADDSGNTNNGTQSGQLSFDLQDTTTGNFIFNNRTSLGGNDSYRQAGFTVVPGHDYTWTWNNVSATNGIQIWLPYSELNPIVTCASDSATCSIQFNPSTGWAPNSNVSVTITARNAGTSTWDSSYYMKRVGPNVVNLQNVSGSVTTNNTYTFTDNVTAPSSGIKTFTYRMYNASGPFGTSCAKPISVCGSSCTTPPGVSFAASCPITNTTMQTQATDYYFSTTTTQPGSYQTTIPPSQWFLYPYPPGPPNAGANPFGLKTYTYTPPPQTTTTQVNETPATEIPATLTWLDGNGNTVDSQFVMIPASGGVGTYTWNTFGNFGSLLPHNAYTAVLSAQITGSFQKDSGSYPGMTEVARADLKKCIDADATTACVAGSGANTEVGQTVDISYTIRLTNETQVPFSIYNMNFNLNPGLQPTGPTSSDLTVPTGTNDIMGKITVINNASSGYSIEFRYGGTVLQYWLPTSPSNDTPSWDATCPGGGGTVATQASSKPYFQIWGSDASAGGAFRAPGLFDTGVCPTADTTLFVSPVNTGNQYSGGIQGFANPYGPGSKSDFGAIALGRIPTGTDSGFFTSLNHNAMFANYGNGFSFGSNPPGGYLNSVSEAHCVSDYFTNTRAVSNPTAFSGDLTNSASGQYTVTPPAVLGGGTIQAGKQITIFVDGDVTIGGNITYDKFFDPTDSTKVPYFALIVRGNIYVSGNVTELDGLYVAQPKTDKTEGKFATCEFNEVCGSQLVVNGAVLAQHVQLLREHGTLHAPSPDVNGLSGNPAEIINYVPSMIIGAPEFVSQFGALETLYSLPPVF